MTCQFCHLPIDGQADEHRGQPMHPRATDCVQALTLALAEARRAVEVLTEYGRARLHDVMGFDEDAAWVRVAEAADRLARVGGER